MDMKIYIANLSAYNAGYLVGQWINLPCDEDEISERIKALLDISNMPKRMQQAVGGPCEEIAIHDYEGPIKISEYDNIRDLNELAESLQSYDEDLIEAVFAYELDRERALKILGNTCVIRDVHTYTELAEKMADEEPAFLGFDYESVIKIMNPSFIDFEQIGRELDCSGEWIISNGLAWYYDNCL